MSGLLNAFAFLTFLGALYLGLEVYNAFESVALALAATIGASGQALLFAALASTLDRLETLQARTAAIELDREGNPEPEPAEEPSYQPRGM